MPDKCPRCGRDMESISAWWSVQIDDEDPELEYVVHVCELCHKEAEQIDKAFAGACAKAKRIWLNNSKVESVSIWGVDQEGTRVNFTGDMTESLKRYFDRHHPEEPNHT